MPVVSAVGLLMSHTHTPVLPAECPLCSRPASFSPSRCKASPPSSLPPLSLFLPNPRPWTWTWALGGRGGSQPRWPTDECMGAPWLRTEAGKILPGQWHPGPASRLPPPLGIEQPPSSLQGAPQTLPAPTGCVSVDRKEQDFPFLPLPLWKHVGLALHAAAGPGDCGCHGLPG